ncbi:MAG: histidinol phosphate aminotransferase [Treponema sp. CETP13]|nr:MAG: histidinol phosphate aminotransferase [Treponema sp. CETP13]
MFSQRLNDLHPYVPGEQPKDREYIKLNANENPYPPPESVAGAVTELLQNDRKKFALYPDPDANDLRIAIADMLNKTGGCLNNPDTSILSDSITADMIFCGNGSDEVLSFVFYAFFGSNLPVVFPEFTYSFYPVYAGYYNIPTRKVPMNNDWSLNIDLLLDAVNGTGLYSDKGESSGLIFANPNAPTSLALTRQQVRNILDKYPRDKVLVIDEAYVDFGQESVLSLVNDYKNLVVIRTFSKSLCFAGMRLGYLVADKDVTSRIFTVKNSFNHFPVDVLAATAGVAACKNITYYVSITQQITKTREWFIHSLRKENWIIPDSQTNFVLCKKSGLQGDFIYQKIKEHGILVRYFATPGINDCVRVSIGTQEQMEKLANIMNSI